MKLRANHEIIGTLTDVVYENDCAKLTFSVEKEIELSAEAIRGEVLKNSIGKRTCIFNCDGIYKIRIIRER